MNLKVLLIALALLGVSLSSCQKDAYLVEERGVQKKVFEKMLTTGSWMETSAVLVSGRDGSLEEGQDLVKRLDTTEKDDLMFFLPNGKFQLTEGKSKWHPNSPEIYQEGQWQLSPNGKNVTVLTGDDVLEYRVVTFDERSLVMALAVPGQKEGSTNQYRLTYRNVR